MEGGKVAVVAVEAATYAFDIPYDYLIPSRFSETLIEGMRVIVPFGRGNRKTLGIVLQIKESAAEGKKLKSVLEVMDESPVLDEKLLRLLLWLRTQSFCTCFDIARAMLPPKLSHKISTYYSLGSEISHGQGMDALQNTLAAEVVAIISGFGGKTELLTLEKHFQDVNLRVALGKLCERGILKKEEETTRFSGDKTVKLYSLTDDDAAVEQFLETKGKTARKQREIVEFLRESETASAQEIMYATGAGKQNIVKLEALSLLTVRERETFRNPYKDMERTPDLTPINLSPAQKTVFDGLIQIYKRGLPSCTLLHGITGSGKTQVYMQLIDECLKDKRQALILTPEIALTPQLLERFYSRYGSGVAVLHSGLSAGERHDEWKRIKKGLANVVVGTRSAVFAPLLDIGLIVIDEEHEHTYKSQSTPRYHARDVAKFRAVQHNSMLLLGSATPAVETAYAAYSGKYPYFELFERYGTAYLPEVTIADMREDMRTGGDGFIGKRLEAEILINLEAGEQTILFLNRRGRDRYVECAECGFVQMCKSCSVSMTYHLANGRLVCHHCGYSIPLFELCPSCGSRHLIHGGAGTQKIEEELVAKFPGASILRMDADTTAGKSSHDGILKRFERENIDILVGTQMVTKGLNFENVTLVGVISADQALYTDDFRAGERTFSLITQVVGRAGRGSKPGRAVIQTYAPENPTILAACAQDYKRFYESEITLRSKLKCPPFYDFAVITVAGLGESEVLRALHDIRRRAGELLATTYRDVAAELLGPAPCGVLKVNNRYRYRLTLRSKAGKRLNGLISELIREFLNNNKSKGLSVWADVNPMEI